MRYVSVCSGIEAFSVAAAPFGWKAAAFAEIEGFPSAVLAHRFPDVPNLGDFTRIRAGDLGPVEVLVGGTPCQGFSVAGLRGGLSDDRSNLALAFVRLAHEFAATGHFRYAIWENVPGCLSMPDNSFGCFLGGLAGADAALRSPLERGRWPNAGMVAGPRARIAWGILDAQWRGLAQRRKRVFLVAGFGDGTDPAAILFERKGLQGNSPPRRQAREEIAPTISARSSSGGGLGTDFDCDGGLIAQTICAGGHSNNPLDETLIAHALRAEGHDASEDGSGRGTPIVPVAFGGNRWRAGVRRITPREAERLQGFPDDWTRIPVRRYKKEPRNRTREKYPDLFERLEDGSWVRFAADGPRYKALGNSFAVPVVSWIIERIDRAEAALR